jgi:drug/metabolite transporter (DMT)-like permease
MRSRRTADIWLLFITFLWGLSFLVVKGALSFSGPYWFLFLRFTLAAAAMAVFFRGALRRLDRQSLWMGGSLALVLYGGFILQTAGLLYTTPAKSAFITGASVVMVPIFGRLVFHSRMSREVVMGILVAFTGLYLLTRPDNLARINRGDVLTFACAVLGG